jgi:hypothetical protein
VVDLSHFDADIEPASALEALRGRGLWRRPDFLGPEAAAGLASGAAEAGWRAVSGADHAFDTAAAASPAAAAFRAALARIGLDAKAPVMVRHPPGAYGAPAPGQGIGCLLDLNEEWASQDGGLLLLVEPEGSVHGWRPAAGALTLYTAARTPLLSMVSTAARQARCALYAEAVEAPAPAGAA